MFHFSKDDWDPYFHKTNAWICHKKGINQGNLHVGIRDWSLPSLTVTVAVVESDSPSESVTVSLKFKSTKKHSN